jgi:penicillin-binding protein 1C
VRKIQAADFTDSAHTIIGFIKMRNHYRLHDVCRKISIAAILSAAAFLTAALAWTFLPASSEIPSFEEVRAARSRSESILLDRHGEILHEQRTDPSIRRLDWALLDDVSPAFISAILFAEDRRFYQHHGVDWASIAGAFGKRGASTVTMQLAAQLDEELQPKGPRRTIRQKLLQIRKARALERFWPKNQILEAYVNLVSYRGELQGLTAAAAGLFGKQIHGLSDEESVILAALVRSPNAEIDRVERRACALAEDMKLGVNPDSVSQIAKKVLSRPYYIRPRVALAPHIAQRLFREAGSMPYRLTCTLDRSLQQFAADTLRRHILAVNAENVRDGAVLVVDNATGDVLAYVGNTGNEGSARYVDGIRGLRQAGSTLKPFFYGAAIDQHILTAASMLDDSPIDIPAAGGIYRPSNYDKVFHGLISVRTALASSINVPAVKTLNLIGVEKGLEVLRSAGFDQLERDDFYGASLALGAADVSLWELVNAYRSLANGGEWRPLRLTFDENPCMLRTVMTPEAAFIIADILSDRESRSRTFSLESPLATRFWTAVKTGTSKDMRDNWCIGFSDRYTVGVWAGNFSGEPMWNVSGVTGAAPVWVDLMNWLHRKQTSSPPSPPPGVMRKELPGRAPRGEWFIHGTEMAVVPGEADVGSRIVYPAPGMVISLDPDIPKEEQKIFFDAQPNDSAIHWVLDGNIIGNAGALLLWMPMPGKHKLDLMDGSDQVLDSVDFEVRS